jgi:signal transduction histidine kinase
VKPWDRYQSIGDVILAMALSVAYQVELWLGLWDPFDATDAATPGSMRWIAAATGLALTSSIAVRRRLPLLGLGLAFLVLVTTGSGGLDGTPALTLTLMVVLYSVGSNTRETSALVGSAGVGGLIAIAILRDPDARLDLGDLLQPVFLLGGSWVAGLAIRVRRDRELALERRAAKLERERDSRAEAAVADERALIARELHDIVAHAIGVIVVQTRGARASLVTDPEASRSALDTIEALGVEAITEMHRLVEVIRPTDDVDDRTPAPGLHDLDDLLARVRGAGLHVEYRVEGTPVEVAPGVDLSAYRIIQEALSNALRHASATQADVVVRYGETDLDLMITDRGGEPSDPSAAPGLGLIGMRERTTLVGGRLEAGPAPDGGFIVRVMLPIRPEGTV